ncbi:MAG: tRNA (guanosine(37)-N1)-methyltransferase TrmD [Candidatus Peribacteraceae bacterium]|nr:tRNA (guanosine(37)-N1)-methyltransferase TrmD [Candidatus Peribacteraceae bacterium]
MRIDILTLFPDMFAGPLTESILKRATAAGRLEINLHDIRKFSKARHSQVDDKPYGGGAGMLMMCEPIVEAIEAITEEGRKAGKEERRKRGEEEKIMKPHRIYFSPRGKRLKQAMVEKMAKKHEWLILLCGHYEGIDQRIIDGGWIDEEISIGDFVLTGGELPAMVLVDAVARHLPGVLGDDASAHLDSFSKEFGRKKEYPHYTRPPEFRGLKVPDILVSGNHAKIEEWRKENLR